MNPTIPKQTAAYTGTFYFRPNHIGCSLVVDGALGALETIPITYVNSAGETTVATNSDEEPLVLSAARPAIPIYFACNLQIAKGITAAAVGVNIHGIE